MLLTNLLQAEVTLFGFDLRCLLALSFQVDSGIQPIPTTVDPLFVECIQDCSVLVYTSTKRLMSWQAHLQTVAYMK